MSDEATPTTLVCDAAPVYVAFGGAGQFDPPGQLVAEAGWLGDGIGM